MVFYVIACNKDDMKEEHIEQVINTSVLKDNNRVLGTLYSLTNKSVDKTQFKVGSLDSLMELMDTFSKYDQQLDASCKRNERLYEEISKELEKPGELKIELSGGKGGRGQTQISVADYIKDFKWDQVRFQMDKSLKVLGAKISGTEKTCQDRLKKQLDEQALNKQKLGQLTKKTSDKFLQTDLETLVYEQKVTGKFFVNTHYQTEYLTSVLVVVPKKKVDQFRQTYGLVLLNHNKNDLENWEKRTRAAIQQANQNIEDEKQKDTIINEEFSFQYKQHLKEIEQPGVIPESEAQLNNLEDSDGNQLWRITCVIAQVSDYTRMLKKAGFHCQRFDYDIKAFVENQKLHAQLKTDVMTLNQKIQNTCYYNFQELFQALLHLKIMRTYIDGVLRFGIPPKFFLGILKPNKNADQKIMDRLTTQFAEEHLKDMYGQKEDANDEDFFPYISNALTSPMFLM